MRMRRPLFVRSFVAVAVADVVVVAWATLATASLGEEEEERQSAEVVAVERSSFSSAS